MTEKEMISGVIDRDREAMKCLVDGYRHKVIKTAYYYLGNMEDAEDLAQEIFLEVVEGMKKFRRQSSMSTWIYRITVNRSLNALKKKKRMKSLFLTDHRIGDDPGTSGRVEWPEQPEKALAEAEQRRLLKEALAALPTRQRTVFILGKYEGLSYKEIAAITGFSHSSVESLMHRAGKNIQQKLERYFTNFAKQ